jgi:hypothetical protein
VLVRRTASPEHADFGGLSSLASLVPKIVFVSVRTIKRHHHQHRASPAPIFADSGWLSVGLIFLLDVICGVESDAGGMSGDHDRCFSMLVLGAFSTGVFNTNAIPRISIDADGWGNRESVVYWYSI